MDKQTLLAAALAVTLIGAPSLALADHAADIAAAKAAVSDANTKLTKAQNTYAVDKTASNNGANLAPGQLDADQKAITDALKTLTDAQTSFTTLTGDLAPDSPGAKSLKNNCAVEQSVGTFRQGGCIVAGALTVPFKWELRGNKDVFGSVSFDGFVGYDPSFAWFENNWNLTLIGFVGYSQNLNSSIPGNATTISSTSASIGSVTYGVGLMAPISSGGTFTPSTTGTSSSSKPHLGVLLGFDHASNALHFQYNDKPWLAIMIGTSF